MVINIKYLIITVISIFLALSIGIFMGAQLDSQSILLEEQKNLIANIQKQFEEINRTNAYMQKEIENLKNENSLNETYIENFFPDYVKGKLAGVALAIVSTTEDYSFREVEKILNLAAANITAVITVTDKVMEATEEEKGQLMYYFGLEENTDLGNLLAQKIAYALASGNTQDIYYLYEEGYVTVRGDFAAVPYYVLIAGGSREKSDKIKVVDIPLIKQLKTLGMKPVGIELSTAANSYMGLYKKQKISTVDNVDSIIGQTSLIQILTGREGNFGIKETADSLMPSQNEGTE